MFIVLKRDWEVHDGSQKEKGGTITAGRHEIERIDNPLGYDAPWLVLKGTKLGQAEGAWRQWSGPEWEDWEVVIEDGVETKK